MIRAGKLENVKSEMTRLGINIMGISETRWLGENEYYSDQFRVIHSGGEESQRGVAIILDKRTANTVEKIRCKGDRLLLVKLKGKPVDLRILQVYMPTSGHRDEEVEEMYKKWMSC